jgi:tetratricopeptide (TPR) repeat protein
VRRVHRYLAVMRASQSTWDRAALAAMWDDLAKDPAIGFHADLAAASWLQSRGDQVEAATRYERGIASALAASDYPPFEPNLRWGLSQRRGEAGFRAKVAEWHAKALASRDPAGLVWVLRSIASGADSGGELGRVVETLRGKKIDDLEVVTTLVEVLLGQGRGSDAWSVLKPHLDAGSPSAEVLALASTVAEREAKLGDAARYLARWMEARADEPTPLETVRAAYRRLTDLYGRMVLRGEDVDASVRATLDAAARWRTEDADNAEIDKRCATTLFAAGRGDQARRFLSSIIERHPAEGSAYADVADVLEQQGLSADDERKKAIEVEPTNPTWLLKRAGALAASGAKEKLDEAKELLDRIDRGTWQPRFSAVVTEARSWQKADKR